MQKEEKWHLNSKNEDFAPRNLFTFTKDDLFCELKKIEIVGFRAKQIWSWIYCKGASSFTEMSNISLNLRQKLSENFSLARPLISSDIAASDGTRKWLIKFSDSKEVEMVFIPEITRGTLCISSQVGCTLSCKFCHTGTQTLVRNLEFHEIVAQVILAKDLLGDWNKLERKITNIVFMGMGEPFFNFDNVSKAIKIMNDADGLDFSLRKITVSTSGLVPEIMRCSSEMKVNLAISLHATNDKVRSEIMAINKKYPLDQLLAACKSFNRQNLGQKITFEYVLLKEVNDSEIQALELVNLVKKFNLNVKINLIPFNSWRGCGFEPSSEEKIKKFQQILKKNNLIAPIRKTRGDDVLGACGQLKSQSIRLKNSGDHKKL